MHWLAVDPESWAQSESPVHLMPVREDHYVHPAALLHPHHRAGEAGLHILHHQPRLGRHARYLRFTLRVGGEHIGAIAVETGEAGVSTGSGHAVRLGTSVGKSSDRRVELAL